MPLEHHFTHLVVVHPTIDKINDLLHRELQLHFLLFFKTFPFLPVLEPFPKYNNFVLVNFSLVGAVRYRSVYLRWFDVS
jgi:hypothetical protein